MTAHLAEYAALYIVGGCILVLGWIGGAFFMRVKLEEQFGRLLADICEEDAGLVPSDYPKADVDREWEQLMRDRLS